MSKSRAEIVGEMRRLRDECQDIIASCEYWNAAHPNEEPINPDPDGRLRRMIAAYDRVLDGDPASALSPRRPASGTVNPVKRTEPGLYRCVHCKRVVEVRQPQGVDQELVRTRTAVRPLDGIPLVDHLLHECKGEPTPPATPQQPVGLVCPFCRDDDFDAVGLKLHLTTYCEAYASVEVGNRVY